MSLVAAASMERVPLHVALDRDMGMPERPDGFWDVTDRQRWFLAKCGLDEEIIDTKVCYGCSGLAPEPEWRVGVAERNGCRQYPRWSSRYLALMYVHGIPASLRPYCCRCLGRRPLARMSSGFGLAASRRL